MKNKKESRLSMEKIISSFLFFLLLCGFPEVVFSQLRLDFPTANPNIENPVPFHLIRKIALVKSVEKWGKGALGNPIPLCDLEENLTAYMFPFHIGGDWFPSYEEIFDRIKEGRELHDHIRNGRIEKAREKYHVLKQTQRNPPRVMLQEIPESISDIKIGYIEPIRPDGTRPRSFEVGEIREIEKFARKKAIGGDEFGTIVVSATYDRVPVPVYFHYLSPYFTHQDLARGKAEAIIGPKASLERIYFLGLRGKFFKFSNARGRVFMHANTLELKDEEISKLKAIRKEKQKLPSIEIGQSRVKIVEEVKKDWEMILTEIGER